MTHEEFLTSVNKLCDDLRASGVRVFYVGLCAHHSYWWLLDGVPHVFVWQVDSALTQEVCDHIADAHVSGAIVNVVREPEDAKNHMRLFVAVKTAREREGGET